MEPGRSKHQRRYPEPVPEDVEEAGPQAVAAWRTRKAAEWAAQHAVLVRRIQLAKEVRRSFMELPSHDARMTVCKFIPPYDMYMLYESNLGEAQAPSDVDFRAWCNRTHVENYAGTQVERACIWDELLKLNYGDVAGPRDPSMTGDQRRWRLYSWAIQNVPNLEAGRYMERSYWFRLGPIPEAEGDDFIIEHPAEGNALTIEFGFGFTGQNPDDADMKMLRAIEAHGLSRQKQAWSADSWNIVGAARHGDGSAAYVMSIIFYEAFANGWIYHTRAFAPGEDVAIRSAIPIANIECNACGASDARHLCDVCGSYAFCGQECSDALATQHQAVCYSIDAEDGHVPLIMQTLGLHPGRDAGYSHEANVSAISAYLEEHDTLPTAVLHRLIAASSTRRRKKRLASHKSHIRTNKNQAAFHKKSAAKHQAVLDDKSATRAQKKEAKKQLAFHNKRATHHERRANVHRSAKAKRQGQLGTPSKKAPQGVAPATSTSTQPPVPPPRDDETIPQRHAREKQELDRRHAAERESLGL